MAPIRVRQRGQAARGSTAAPRAVANGVPAAGAVALLWLAWAPGPAAPPTRPDSTVYLGAGSHKLQAWFSVRVDRPGELQFVVPRIAQGKLSLRLPGKTDFLQSLVYLGAQRVGEDDRGTLLEVDLGAWTQPGTKRAEAGP